MKGNVREFDDYEDESVQRAPKLHESQYYKKGMSRMTDERTEQKTKSKTRNMPVDEGHPAENDDEELTGYSYRW